MAGRLLSGLAGLAAAVALLLVLTDLPGRPVPLEPSGGLSLLVVDHGYHAGLILPRAALAERAQALGLVRLGAVASRFVAYDHLEIGWGEEGFYRHVPRLTPATVPDALQALLASQSPSVLHVVGIAGAPAAYFTASDMLRLQLDQLAFDRIATEIEATLAPGTDEAVTPLGPGLYGPSLFFRAVGAYHLTRNCNHWIARLLNAAGRRVSLAAATVSAGLMADLRWRSGATAP